MLLDTGEIMEMTDKDWLQRVSIAYKAYQYPNKDIEAFISWLYKQYGIVEQKDKE
jgi:hypothetical protein